MPIDLAEETPQAQPKAKKPTVIALQAEIKSLRAQLSAARTRLEEIVPEVAALKESADQHLSAEQDLQSKLEVARTALVPFGVKTKDWEGWPPDGASIGKLTWGDIKRAATTATTLFGP